MSGNLRHKYMKRVTIRNDDVSGDIEVYFNHLLTCNNIDKSINEILDNESTIEKEKRLGELFSSSIEECECNEIIDAIKKRGYLSTVSSMEYCWLKKVISIVENMPICITIACAREKHFGFPLIYANKQFEKTTGYNTREIIGKNCKFLQPDAPILEEESRCILMRNSLRLGKPSSVIITNVKKSGDRFHNLLSFKAVFDNEDNYLYCIGIQTEITIEQINTVDVQNIIDVIHFLTKMNIDIIS